MYLDLVRISMSKKKDTKKGYIQEDGPTLAKVKFNHSYIMSVNWLIEILFFFLLIK